MKNEWIKVNDRLPEGSEIVLGIDNKNIIYTAFYAKPHSVEYDDDDYQGEYDPIEEENGCLFLKEGWYEEVDIHSEFCYVNRFITHWQPLPEPPQD